MKKKFTLLLTAFSLLAFLTPPHSVMGQTYNYVKETSSIQVGDVVALVYESGTKELSGFSSTSTVYGIGADYTSAPTGAYALTVVEGKSEGSFAFQNGDNYIQWSSGNSLNTKTTIDNNSSWTVSFSDGNATIANISDNSRTIRWNNNSPRFACYVNGQQAVQLYKRVEVATHTLTINTPTGGTITVTDAQQQIVSSGTQIAEGAVLNITATPNAGYEFGSWSATSGTLGDANNASTTFTMGTDDATLSAKFTQNNTEYNVNIDDDIENGSITANPTQCVSGTTVTLTIMPDDNYHLETLSITDDENNVIDYTEGYTFTMPASNVTVTGTFTNTTTDELTATIVNAAMSGSSGYQAWSNVSGSSGAKYAGQSNYNTSYIQIRNQTPSGIVSTTTGGCVKKVSLEWKGNNTNNRTITVYGKNSAYESSDDLYGENTRGESLGTIVYGSSTELTVSGDYRYVGILANGAAYIDPIQITWAPDDNPAPYIEAENVEIAYDATETTISFTINNPVEGGTISAIDDAEWILEPTIDEANEGYSLIFTTEENEGLARQGIITLTYFYGNNNNETVTKNVTVTQAASPNAPGTVNNPYTVAQARDAIDANTGTTGVYVKGVIYQVDGYYNNYHSITYWIADEYDGETPDAPLEVYSGKSFDGGNFTDQDDLKVNDTVVVKGNLTLYNNNNNTTYEFSASSQLVSLVRPVANGEEIEDLTIAEGMTYVVPSGVTLTLTGTTTSTTDNLIIKDGGQLIHTEAVNATLQKDIASYSSKDGASGWYTVASPVNGAPVSTLTSGTYDLYSYDEANHQWYNQKAHSDVFTTLSRGQGYLYANSADKVVSFAGSMESTSATVEVTLSKQDGTSLAGYNLVGNPFTRNLTSTDVIKIGSTNLNTYYFVAGGSELESTTIGERDIKAGEGFFVQASTDGEKLTFNYSAKGETAAKPAYVCIEAGDESFMDRAYVQVGQGNTLRKMTLNDNVAHVYVLHNEADYAAATIEAAEGEMPVCFKAAHDGQYTLNVNTKGLDADYLHLIDNFTGADIDLIASPSYTFDAKAADHACRFRLMFDASENNGASTLATAFAYLSNGEIVITGAEADATLQIMDMTGRVVAIRDAARNVSTAGMPAGVYVLRLVNGSDVKTQKMVIR